LVGLSRLRLTITSLPFVWGFLLFQPRSFADVHIISLCGSNVLLQKNYRVGPLCVTCGEVGACVVVLRSRGVSTTCRGLGSATAVRACSSASGVGAGSAVVSVWLVGVEDSVEGRGRGGDPSLLGRVWAHASGVVGGSAYRAFEELEGPSCLVQIGDEGDILDGGSPFPQGCVVLGWWVDIDVPGWVALSFACPDVFFLDEVESGDIDGVS